MSEPLSLSYLQDARRRFCQNRAAIFSLALLVFFCLMAIIGPMLSPYTYSKIQLSLKNLPPCSKFWFGSDDLGRDVFCRVWWGARISLSIGITAALLDGAIGVAWGSIAAYFGGWIDELMMRICDALNTIPTLLMVILLTVYMGSGLKTIFIALSLVGWINMARITRAQILQIKQNDYIMAAIAIGASVPRIVLRHLIPNALGPILATVTMTIPAAIFTEAFLSFLGLGLQAPLSSWGIMINEGIGAMEFYPWRLFFPSCLICLTMLSFNIIGNALRDALDPRLRDCPPRTQRVSSKEPENRQKLSLCTATENTVLLDVQNLNISFSIQNRKLHAVRGVSFQLHQQETIGIVGESGCGKSSLVQSLLRLIPSNIESGKALLRGVDLLKLSQEELRKVRGKEIGIVFQDPMTSLNPTMRIGAQIEEAILYHRLASKQQAKVRALELLSLTGISDPELRYTQFSHQLSGGMRQRALIAIALSARPNILIADEPTSALDPTIQTQILQLLKNLRRELKMSQIIITHDIGAIASLCDRALVMYAGKIVEAGRVQEVLTNPLHPYTKMLLDSLPTLKAKQGEKLFAIEGSPPSLFAPPQGCPFAARCPHAMERCTRQFPDTSSRAACWLREDT